MEFLSKKQIDDYSLNKRKRIDLIVIVMNKALELIKDGCELQIAFGKIGNNIIIYDCLFSLRRHNKALYHEANRSGFYYYEIGEKESLHRSIVLINSFLSQLKIKQ